MIEVHNIWKSYRNKSVLKGVSFKIEEGKIFCVIGPNGSGKTTILKIIDMLEEPSRGEILFNSVNILSLKENEKVAYRKKMAMLFQQPTLYNMKVHENIALGLKIRKFDKTILKQKIQCSLKEVGLLDYADKHAYTLSGGEAQRLCLAMALALEPEVLLLDEPTANLDPANIIIVENIIRNYAKNNGLVIYTTHNMFEAKRLADRIALLVDGSIIEEASTEDFFGSPRDERVAKFVRGEIVFG
ncbi:MAG: phosphate ABC transporter ATP-binding protein [Nitrososphaeria archaeon]